MEVGSYSFYTPLLPVSHALSDSPKTDSNVAHRGIVYWKSIFHVVGEC